jgi:hypothetical protein
MYFAYRTAAKKMLFLYLVISLAEELELLGLLVHEYPVQVTRLHRPDLDGLSMKGC